MTLSALALLALLTPRITFNDGLGNDGVFIANLTEGLRGRTAPPPWGPFVYRLLPSALVALTPFDVATGFLVVNILSIVGSTILLLRLLDRYRVPRASALLGLTWWLSLPMGPRWDIYYPVLGDAFGFFILVALILCALERRLAFFAAALVAGVLSRENLVMMIPFLWRAYVRSAPLRWTLLVALVSVPAIAALMLVRAFPPVPPAFGSSAMTQVGVIADEVSAIIDNRNGQAWRVLLAGPLSLGLLLMIPVFRPRATLRFLSREMHWMYFAGLAIIGAGIGGKDTDRYLYILAPLLLIVTFAVHGDLWKSWPRAAVLTTVQFVSLRVGWPIGTTEYEYLQYTTGFMELDRLFALALLMALASAIAALVVVSRKHTTGHAELSKARGEPADAVSQAR